MIEQNQQFKGRKDKWQMHFQLKQQSIYLQIHCQQSMQTFEAQMTLQKIQEDKNFSFFFQNIKDLYKFLQTSYNEIQINREGWIIFVVGMPVGKITKNIQFKIPTIKKEVDQNTLVQHKIKTIQKNLQILRLQNQQLHQTSNNQENDIKNLREQLKNLQKALSQKDDVLNSIFSQLSQINKWREQKDKRFEDLLNKKKFIADQMNSHNIKFSNIGNRYKKNCGGSWDVLICKYQIQKNQIYRYVVKQIKAGNNGSFMYGIGTASIRGINRAQDHKEFIGYYQNTGFIYDKGESKKVGPKIKDGETITIEVDTKNWKISWYIQQTKEAEVVISGELKIKPLYLAIIVFNQESEIQFI